MSVILAFNPEARRSRRIAPADERRGEIVFFTGVRIERHAEDSAEPVAGSDRSVKARKRRKA